VEIYMSPAKILGGGGEGVKKINEILQQICEYLEGWSKNVILGQIFPITGYRKKRGISSVGNPKKNVGFVGIIFRPSPQYFSQLCQFSSNFEVSYHFRIRTPNK
jgi:hypothetical protein